MSCNTLLTTRNPVLREGHRQDPNLAEAIRRDLSRRAAACNRDAGKFMGKSAGQGARQTGRRKEDKKLADFRAIERRRNGGYRCVDGRLFGPRHLYAAGIRFALGKAHRNAVQNTLPHRGASSGTGSPFDHTARAIATESTIPVLMVVKLRLAKSAIGDRTKIKATRRRYRPVPAAAIQQPKIEVREGKR